MHIREEKTGGCLYAAGLFACPTRSVKNAKKSDTICRIVLDFFLKRMSFRMVLTDSPESWQKTQTVPGRHEPRRPLLHFQHFAAIAGLMLSGRTVPADMNAVSFLPISQIETRHYLVGNFKRNFEVLAQKIRPA